jgi:hypothetical protein
MKFLKLNSRVLTGTLVALAGLAAVQSFVAGPAAADGSEAPSDVVAIVNGPGAITVSWKHSGIDVYAFVVEQKMPAMERLLPATMRAYTVVELTPNTYYRYRVCAVFDYNRICSEYTDAVRTLPPEQIPPPKPPPPPPPPVKPVLQATPATATRIGLDWKTRWQDCVTSIELYRNEVKVAGDGSKFWSPGCEDGNYGFRQDLPRPNTDYSYKVCLINRGGTTCSDPVTTAGKPVQPTEPVDVRIVTVPRPGGLIVLPNGVQLWSRNRGNVVHVDWRNSDVPGRYLTVERKDSRVKRNPDTNSPIRWLRQETWNEVKRLDAKSDPTSTYFDVNTRRTLTTLTTGSTYRVCADVPALGTFGKSCSQPVNSS